VTAFTVMSASLIGPSGSSTFRLSINAVSMSLVYSNGTRAILAFKKGASGQQAFDQAFAAWNEKIAGNQIAAAPSEPNALNAPPPATQSQPAGATKAKAEQERAAAEKKKAQDDAKAVTAAKADEVAKLAADKATIAEKPVGPVAALAPDRSPDADIKADQPVATDIPRLLQRTAPRRLQYRFGRWQLECRVPEIAWAVQQVCRHEARRKSCEPGRP
jgi:hypothetical protein